MNPLQIGAIVVASEDSNRLRSTPRIIDYHMVPQSLEDPHSALVGELFYDLFLGRCLLLIVARRAVAVAYMQRWARLLVGVLKLQVLCHSPRRLFDSAAYVFVFLQAKLFCVPQEYVMAISLTCPHRLWSTAVQFGQNMTHDDLPLFSKIGFSEIEDFTDANRIGAFGNDHLADLIGKVLLVMMPLFRLL